MSNYIYHTLPNPPLPSPTFQVPPLESEGWWKVQNTRKGKMGVSKLCALMVLLLISNLSAQKTRAVEGRPLSSSSTTERYWKIFATLGMVCECCDGEGGECSSSWNLSCSNLQCSPWKSH